MERTELSTGISVAYELSGPADAPPLLLLAPMGRDHSRWDALLPQLSQQFRCIAPDYRGTGESDRPESGYSIPQFADDAQALLVRLEIEAAHVAGSSMGSAVAMELAIADPSRVRSLSLYTPWARCDEGLRGTLGVLRSLTLHAPPLDVERAVSRLVFSDEYLAANRQAIDEHARATVEDPRYPPRHAAVGHIDAGIAHDVLARLESVAAPTLVVAGEHDRLVPPHHAEVVRDAVPGARYHLFEGPGSSHGLTIERQVEFLDVALHFLRDLSGSSPS